MKKACVIGWPIEHSRSPIIHNYWLKKYGIEGCYTKEAVTPGGLEDFLRSLATAGYAGCNVTVPHKEAAFARADVREPSAIAVGAANTLWLDGGKLHAANTDTYGFMTNLAAQAPQWNAIEGPVAVLGAGGAARAVIHGFLEAGRTDIRVINRSIERAGHVQSHFSGRVMACDWAAANDHASKAAIVVNTTTLGMGGKGHPGINVSGLRRDCVVADIVYVPLETGFLREAREHGLQTVEGLGMLLHQAVPGFSKWFGVEPEVTAELRGLIEADIKGHL